MERKKLIAQAHLAANQLGLDEETRRAVQLRVAGARSCSDMDEAALLRLIAHYKRAGARVFVPREREDTAGRTPLVRKIYALSEAAGVPYPAYALGIVRQMQGAAPDRLEWVPAPLLRKVVAAMTYQTRRRAAKEAR